MKYNRVLLKISGEALAGKQNYGIDSTFISNFAKEIQGVHDLGIELAIVVGGGNIHRGVAGAMRGMDRATSDHIGMLATVMNALAMQDALENLGIYTRIMSAIEMREIAEPYIRRRAVRHLEKGRVVIFAGGTGNPYFTTDTAAALRANEVNAEVILKATKVDGVFDKDPVKHSDATLIKKSSYIEIINKNIKVMDSTSITMCMDNKLNIVVFNLFKEGNILKAVKGEEIGSLITVNIRRGVFMDSKEIKEEMVTAIEKTLDSLKSQLKKVRTGRASQNSLDGLKVNYYGTPTDIKQVAQVSVPEARLLQIHPFEKSLIPEIERTIINSNLGLTPANDGSIIRLSFPLLTEEKRLDLVKGIKKLGEESKVAVRNIRRDQNEKVKKLEKAKEISEDISKNLVNETQKVTDEYIEKINLIIKGKEQELLTL